MRPLLETVKEHDVKVALVCGAIFFILEFFVIALLLPWVLEHLAERRRRPVQQIAARRILSCVADLLRVDHSLILSITVANQAGGMSEPAGAVAETFYEFDEGLAKTAELLTRLSGAQPTPQAESVA